jgi:hypothetical protein
MGGADSVTAHVLGLDTKSCPSTLWLAGTTTVIAKTGYGEKLASMVSTMPGQYLGLLHPSLIPAFMPQFISLSVEYSSTFEMNSSVCLASSLVLRLLVIDWSANSGYRLDDQSGTHVLPCLGNRFRLGFVWGMGRCGSGIELLAPSTLEPFRGWAWTHPRLYRRQG